MSPSSAGNGPSNLEVEHYIGSYLISSTARSKNNQRAKPVNSNNNYHHREMQSHPQRVYTPPGPNIRYATPMTNCAEGWAGGMPLISMANHQRRGMRKNNNNNVNNSNNSNNNVPFACPNRAHPPADEFRPHTQLSRLAIHTHGFPLILAGRYNNRKNGNFQPKYSGNHATNGGTRCMNNHENVNSLKSAVNPPSCDNSKDNAMVSNIDTLSVASDESSGSNNSENCLPRIIKPRKRRKKDRKPTSPLQTTTEQSETPAIKTELNNTELKTASPSNLVTLKPYIPLYYSNNYNHPMRNHYVDRSNDHLRSSYASESNIPLEISDIPKLTHDFDDVKDDSQNQCSPISCQCKFCDPSGQIWDIDSPFLTSTESMFFSNSIYPSSFSEYSYHRDTSTENDDAIVDKMASALRRSWSDPVSSFGSGSDDPEFVSGTNVGVIGAGRLCREWHGNPSVLSGTSSRSSDTSQSVHSSTSVLDISTEIVTSHNGHRDLEIKFFTSHSATVDDKSNLFCAYESNDKVRFSGIDGGDCWNLDGRNLDEKDCDISYDTAHVDRLLLQIEE